MIKHYLFILNCVFFLHIANAQTNITNLSEKYHQDFNTLSDTTLTNSYETLPANWMASEVGSNANLEYRASHGQYAGGDLYSFGDSLSKERALGSIGSGSVSKVSFGTAFTNSSLDTIRSIHVKYTGEMWRLGNPARSTGPDTLTFSYAVNPINLNEGDYFVVDELSFQSPVSSGTDNAPLMGNKLENIVLIEDTFLVKIAPKQTILLRWTDYNSSSYDDGLAIDDLEIEFLTNKPTEEPGLITYNPINDLKENYTQNFNSLSDTTLTNSYETLPANWMASEVGSNANLEYRASHGQYAGGDLYSFGDSLSKERALGSIGSGSVSKVSFGTAFTNLTKDTVKSVVIKYTGEMWRLGNPERSTGPDTLFFSYAINATEINEGAYSYVEKLHFYSPIISGTANTSLLGNDLANTSAITDTLAVTLSPNQTLWIKWTDFNSSSYDDALAVDELDVSFIKKEVEQEEPVNSDLYIPISAFNETYFQDFNSLSNTYGVASFETLPKGWFAKENGANSDGTYNVSYGEFGGGNIYSYGDSSSTDRALGSIGSGTNNLSFYGAAFINTTGKTIENIQINYTGEQWRQGRPGLDRSTGPDTLHFSFAINAKTIETGDYQPEVNLNFFSPREDAELNTPLNGNSSENKKEVKHVLFNLNIAAGDTLWIRWKDNDSQSYDDGLAIDSFSLAAIENVSVPEISFNNAKNWVTEINGLIDIPLSLTNASEYISQAEVFIADTGTIDLQSDIELTSSIIQFDKENPSKNYTFIINNQQPFEQEEYFVLGLRNLANAGIGSIKYDTIYIQNYAYPEYTISDLKENNEEGISLSLNEPVLITGVVHGINFSSSSLDFFLLEDGTGINVYNNLLSNYQPTEGDELKIWGIVSQYRGLTRLVSLDSLQLINTNSATETPKTTSTILEENESSLIKVAGLQLSPAIANWPISDYATAINNNSELITIYISAESEYAGKEAPSGEFSITGIGSQFTESYTAPFENGYRIMALTIEKDITALTDPNLSVVGLYPNPFSNQLTISTKIPMSLIRVSSAAGNILVEKAVQGNETLLSTTELDAGIYIIQVEMNNAVRTFKVVKR